MHRRCFLQALAIPASLRLTPAHAATGEIVVVNWGGDAVLTYDAIWAQPFNAKPHA